MSNDLLTQIFLEDPYKDFPADQYELDLQTWTSNDPIFRRTIKECRPSVLIEVGVWKGATAIRWAKMCAEENIKASILSFLRLVAG